MADDNVKAQMRKGILEYCILAILSRGDSYAPKIIAELKAAEMIVVEGTLYPLLTRLKNDDLLSYEWKLDQAWTEMVQQIEVIRHGGKTGSGQPA